MGKCFKMQALFITIQITDQRQLLLKTLLLDSREEGSVLGARGSSGWSGGRGSGEAGREPLLPCGVRRPRQGEAGGRFRVGQHESFQGLGSEWGPPCLVRAVGTSGGDCSPEWRVLWKEVAG